MRMNVRGRLVAAINGADRLICVSEALRNVAIHAGADADRVVVVGNGIDLDKFHAVSQADARRKLRLPGDAKVLVSVGTLVERKGFHRVIECLPALLERFPNLHYLVVGGAGPEGDIGARLRKFVTEVGVTDRVHFLGAIAPDGLNVPLSAADVFVLATSYEGWANVFLEAMACGLPVVSTKVGGNPQVINAPHLGSLVEFGDQNALTGAIADALERDWDRERIVAYARENTWDSRIDVLLGEFRKIVAGAPERTREREGDNPVSRPQ